MRQSLRERQPHRRARIAILLAGVLLAGCSARADGPVVLGAASLRDAVGRCLTAAAPSARTSWAATSTLVRQLDHGAHADLVLSAHPDWTAVLTEGHAAEATTLARNRLVLAGPSSLPPPHLDTLTTAGCVVLGDPRHVPMGRYAQHALTSMGRWAAVAPKVLATLDATAAAAALGAGRCEVGVVYATEQARPGIVIADAIAPASQPDIRYDAVPLSPAGTRVLDALLAPPCQQQLRDAHFGSVEDP